MGCTGDDEAYVVIDGFLEAKSCIGVFVLLYYFGFAGNMWWMMLVVMWFYSNVKEAKQKHLEKVLKNTHVVAWVTSVVPTIVVLVMKLIDAGKYRQTKIIQKANLGKALLRFLRFILCVYHWFELVSRKSIFFCLLLLRKRISSDAMAWRCTCIYRCSSVLRGFEENKGNKWWSSLQL